jgi:hypothetical protein
MLWRVLIDASRVLYDATGIAAPLFAFSNPSIEFLAARPDRTAGMILAAAAEFRHTTTVPPQGGSCKYPVATASIASKLFAAANAYCAGTEVEVTTSHAWVID